MASTETQTRTDEIKEIAALAARASGMTQLTIPAPEGARGVPAEIPAIVEHGDTPRLHGLAREFEAWRTAPERRAGTAHVTTLAAFIDLTRRHQDEDSALFARALWPDPSLTAVIDYHRRDGEPRFARHRVHYPFPLTDEFQAWITHNGKPFDQAEFAAFVEEHAAELASPLDAEKSEYERLFHTSIATPADLIRLSRGLQVHVTSQVKHNVTLSSGEGEITFLEEHQNTKGEKVSVPGVFMLSVPAFLDGDPVRIPARLRYRVREGSVKWFYQLYRWESELRGRVVADLDRAASETGLPASEGAP